MNIYYVYFYLRSKDSQTAKAGTPYYVGKGTKNRAYIKHNNINKPLDKSKIIIVEQNLTELQAFILERYYIRWFGRKDISTGILMNKTDGGEGVSGSHVNKGRTFSVEHKEKLSKAKLGKSISKEHKEKLHSSRKGTKNSKEHIEKMILGRIEKGNSQETKRKMSESRKKLQDRFDISRKAGIASGIAYKNDPARQKRHSERMTLWWSERKEKINKKI